MNRRNLISLARTSAACVAVLYGCRTPSLNKLVETVSQQSAFGRPSADLWRLPTARVAGRIKELAEAGVTLNETHPMQLGNEFTSRRLRIREVIRDGVRLHFVYFDLDVDCVTVIYTFDSASNRWLHRWILKSDL